jgi:molybdate transport system substrate-binding protein
MVKSDRKADAHAFLDWMLTPAVQAKLAALGLGAMN